MRFDLWTGEDDKILRRIEVEFGFEVPKDLQQDTQGVERGKVKMALEIADVNEDQDDQGAAATRGRCPSCRARSALAVARAARPAAPRAAARRRRLLGRRLLGRRLVRRRRRAAGTDLGSGGGQSGIDSKRSQRYLDCLSEAKKPADIEKCAAILEE